MIRKINNILLLIPFLLFVINIIFYSPNIGKYDHTELLISIFILIIGIIFILKINIDIYIALVWSIFFFFNILYILSENKYIEGFFNDGIEGYFPYILTPVITKGLLLFFVIYIIFDNFLLKRKGVSKKRIKLLLIYSYCFNLFIMLRYLTSFSFIMFYYSVEKTAFNFRFYLIIISFLISIYYLLWIYFLDKSHFKIGKILVFIIGLFIILNFIPLYQILIKRRIIFEKNLYKELLMVFQHYIKYIFVFSGLVYYSVWFLIKKYILIKKSILKNEKNH